MKKLFTLFLALAASVGTMFADKVKIGDLYYNLNDTNLTAEVANSPRSGRYTGDITIPSYITYESAVFRVTSIGSSAFSSCSGLTSISIPNSITSIGNDAFYGCSGLTSMFIPNSVTTIGYRAFDGCSGLTSIFIPNNVTTIGYHAFYGCSGLTSIVVENGNPIYDSRNNCNALIETASNTLMAGCQNTVIPNSVTSIGAAAFAVCNGLVSISIPNSITTIGVEAFLNCRYLKYVMIGNSVDSIGEWAFKNCSRLESVIMSSSVTSIGEGAFGSCTALTDINIPNTITSIGKNAFNSVRNIIYTGTLSGSPWGALCVNGYVDGWLVYSNESKTNLRACSSLATGEITIPNSVTSIGERAFDRCSRLSSITIGNNVRSIEEMAFANCSRLTSITIPNSVISIGNDVFNTCYMLRSVTLNSDAIVRKNRSADDNLIKRIGNVGEYILGNDITGIGTNAFYGCSQLKTLSLGENISYYGDSAFYGCSALTSITNYRKTPAKLGENTFKNVDYFTCSLYVFAGSIDMYKFSSSDWKDFYFILPIGASEADVSSVIVTPEKTSAEIAWPQVSGAASYDLVIRDNNGDIICTLAFNAQGQLTSIAFNAPSRNNAPQQVQEVGFAFTVTGLEGGKTYNYTLIAKNASGATLQTEQGTFTTLLPEAIDQIGQDPKTNSRKLLRNGQIFILRGDKTYTITGQEVR